MTPALNNIIAFYRDAYQQEYRTEKISNFFAKGVTHRYFPKTFKLVSQSGYQLPVATDWGREVAAELALTSSERKLVLGVFFVKGKGELLGKTRTLFPPLLLLDLELVELNEAYLLEADLSSLTVNPAALDYLGKLSEHSSMIDAETDAPLAHPEEPFTFTGLHHLKDRLNALFPSLNLGQLDDRIVTDEPLLSLETAYKSRSDKYRNTLLPELAVGLVDKPKKSKGIINELGELAGLKHGAGSTLHYLFNGDRPPTLKGNTGPLPTVVPVSLSEDQRRLVYAAGQSPVSLVIGPPGTGKSFSIAALAVQLAHEGKTVLVASKNEQACRVIYDKINRDIGIRNMALDASRPRFRGTVAARLRNLAAGVSVGVNRSKILHNLEGGVHGLQTRLSALEEELREDGGLEKKWGDWLTETGGGLMAGLRKKWVAFRTRRRRPVWDTLQEIGQKTKLLRSKQRDLIKVAYRERVRQTLQLNRLQITSLERAYRQEHGNVSQRIFSETDYGAVFTTLPIWICTSANLADVLPLEENLVDVVIIDEASQCDIASSIPLLYRAKSAVVVGDPHQLRHVSFLSRQAEADLRAKHRIDRVDITYRDQSILDLAQRTIADQRSVTFLSEHYRSMPDIIAFSNKQFYEGALKIMTANPRTMTQRHLHFEPVRGVRAADGTNEVEAAAIVERVRELIATEAELDRAVVTSIGIISPIRSQVNLLKRLLRRAVEPNALRKHRVMAGTPFSFQGEERDEVFLSLVVDADTHPAVYRYLERPDVFNVSITRAKLKQHVFHSVDPKQLTAGSLLADYLGGPPSLPTATVEDGQFFDQFFEEVLAVLEARVKSGATIHRNKIISGCLLDVLIVQDDELLAVDLVGYPGAFSDQLSEEGIRRLERVNIKVFMLPYSAWIFERTAAERALRAYLG